MRNLPKTVVALASLAVLIFGFYLSNDLSIHNLTHFGVPQAYAEDDHDHPEGTKWTCGMHPMIIVDEPGLCPICHMDLTPMKEEINSSGTNASGERKIKFWQAPMDPTYISDAPGKSPMGMDLIPVYEDEATGGTLISIDPTTIQNMGVRTAGVIQGNLSRTLRTVGMVDYEEPKQYVVNAKTAGWIEKLYVAETGQQVKKGQKLLEIYSPDLVTAQQELLLARDNYNALKESSIPEIAESSRRLLESSRKRLELWDVSKRQIAELERTGQAQKTVTLYAPYSGIVTMKMVNEGMYVKPGMALLDLADLSKVWILADIYEYQLPWVKVGQPARVELSYTEEDHLNAHISYLYPFVDPKTRTVKARIEFENPDLKLRPDMYVTVYLTGEKKTDVLIIPQEAVLYTGEKQTVFVAMSGGRFEPRLVKTGLLGENGHVEVKSGLFEGEQVVTSAQFMLDSESKLREAIQKMMNPVRAGTPQKKTEESLDDLFSDESSEEVSPEELFN